MFSQSMYSVNEGARVVQPVLVLNRMSSDNITVVVNDGMPSSGTAAGKYYSILINYK